MVASVSSSTGNSNSAVSNWADSIYAKLDTRNQGYIEKSDLQAALSKAGADGGGRTVDVDDSFSALDGDSDGKVTKSELTEAMSKLSDQLNAQFDASRIGRGGPPPDGPPPDGAPAADQDSADASSSTDASATRGANGMAGMGGAGGPHGPHGGGRAAATSGTSSTSADYVAAADTDNNGTVSDAEQAAYDKKVASQQADGSSSSSGDSASGTQKAAHQKDPMRELAHALHLLKAYAENSGSSDATAASASETGSSSTSTSTSVSVEA
jgi:Ca2+-binding EF-hand superfamily protein